MKKINGMIMTRSTYFFIVSIIVLLIVFLGFAPTFYLRPFFGLVDQPTNSTSLPTHLVLHGIALTAWYTLFCVQTYLVAFGKTANHRRLGFLGLVVALAVFASGFVVLMNVVPRRFPAMAEVPSDVVSGFRGLVLFQTYSLCFFALLVALAAYLRRKAPLHKRLMFFASIIILAAAFSENRLFGALMHSLLPDVINYGTTVQFLIVASLFVHDWMRHRKIFAVTIIGAVITIPAPILFTGWAMENEIVTAYADWLIAVLY